MKGTELIDAGYRYYRKIGAQLMRPYIEGEDMTGISVSPEDTPEVGGMIAVNEANDFDKWYIAKDFFEHNYEEVDSNGTD